MNSDAARDNILRVRVSTRRGAGATAGDPAIRTIGALPFASGG
jgi:hypothetical protein